MSRAARIPSRLLSGDDLPPLTLDAARVREATPNPAPGPERDRLALLADATIRGYEEQMAEVLNAYLERVGGVVGARARSPKARKGTRWWRQENTAIGPVGGTAVATKARPLDAAYVLNDSLISSVADVARPVALRIVADAVTDTGRRLGRPDVGLAAFDQEAVDTAVESAVEALLGVAGRHAEEVRQAIMDADATAADLDEVLDRIDQAHRRGGNWLLLYGRTLATALAADAALAAARALGVTHTQWLSRRDTRVRHTHRIADGQVRRIGDTFRVGAHNLRFPADPSGLPDTWEEVANCRCGLLFATPDKEQQTLALEAHAGTPAAAGATARAAAELPAGAPSITTPDGLGLPLLAPLVQLPATTVAYRQLEAPLALSSGQWITWGTAVVAALGAVAATNAATLLIVMPAGTTVGVASGTVIFPPNAVFEILEVTEQGVVARPVQA